MLFQKLRQAGSWLWARLKKAVASEVEDYLGSYIYALIVLAVAAPVLLLLDRLS